MADGKECKCAAHSESECGCDVDWTPQEVYDLRAENKRLKGAIRRMDTESPLSVVLKRLRRDGHDDEADGLVAVDHLMREYAYTDDTLDDVATAMAAELRAVVDSWKAASGGE
jgi:hypothetical protein